MKLKSEDNDGDDNDEELVLDPDIDNRWAIIAKAIEAFQIIYA